MAPTRPLSLNKCNSRELPNAAAISSFKHITRPTTVSIHDKTLKGAARMTYVKLLSPPLPPPPSPPLSPPPLLLLLLLLILQTA